MSISEAVNAHAPEETPKESSTPAETFTKVNPELHSPTGCQAIKGPPINPQVSPSRSATTPPKPRPKRKRPNYAQIHSKPLPLTIHPLPAFHPSNPISLLRLSYIYICHLFSPPSSHPDRLYTGLFSPRTRSVHITDPEHVRALWEMGFFGKGTLSRSEPSWVEREKAKSARARDGGGAEAATARRREERRLFKLERARMEREKIEWQRAVEEGRVVPDEGEGRDVESIAVGDDEDDERTLVGSGIDSSPIANGSVEHKALRGGHVPDANLLQTPESTARLAPAKSSAVAVKQGTDAEDQDFQPDLDIEDEEHLQLTLEEAFYLTFALGILSTHPPPAYLNPAPFHPGPTPYSTTDLLFLSCHHSAFPPVDSGSGIAPDDQFLLNYVTYHHFRSLGWVVRPGVKFGVDYLLYNRGPVFSHAEFAVLIIPSYTHRYWNTPGGRSRRRIHYPSEMSGFSTLEEDGGAGEATNMGKDWWFLHCINRVQSQVRKSLVLCYVDIPSPWEVGLDDEWDVDVDVGRLLRGYRLREFVVKRWVINRSRD